MILRGADVSRKKKGTTADAGLFERIAEEPIALHTAAEERYLNYALSVITARALPDVRDGLKPVQRRILYTMHEQGLSAKAKPRKCSKVVGDVMGNYHPHGGDAIYEALVRMAQNFALRVPLVDGHGNFGSVDGDSAAAMRYTECRLSGAAAALLDELDQKTVPLRGNYDGTREEPQVLPAAVPNLLINGCTGIAVGMATQIPPFNPREVLAATLKLLDHRDLAPAQLAKILKGPDFPTGGWILNTAEELREILRTGSGSLKVRAVYEEGETTRSSRTIIITAIPYGVNKSTLVEAIAEAIAARKLPQLLDVRDLSADDVRIELELRRDADSDLVLAWLFKNTPLQVSWSVNMTCLVPTSREDVLRPERIGVREILGHFLDFRLDVVTRKLNAELAALETRLHVLAGFEKIFDALDEILKIIRKSEGKADAAKKIMERFDLDELQTEAILELKLYRLARLEILVIREELDARWGRAKAVKKLLANVEGRWELVRTELNAALDLWKKDPAGERRTLIETASDEPELRAEDFIIEEENCVILTRDGWVKRQRELKDLSKTRLRQGDEVLAAVNASTRATVAFFSDRGTCCTARVADLPASTGHGEPIQKFFKLDDGERILAAISLDPAVVGKINAAAEGAEPPVHALALSSDGMSVRFPLSNFIEPSTRNGRRYMKLNDGARVLGVVVVHGSETVIAATKKARALLAPVSEIAYLSGPGKGVIFIKLAEDDEVLGFIASTGDRDLLTVETTRGAEQTISTAKYEPTGRGGAGRELMKTGGFTAIVRPTPRNGEDA
jgi:DNA gyrase subunit A